MKTMTCAALALLLSIPAAARGGEKPAALPPELSWVPPNCTAFVHVRFAELWDSPAGKTVRDGLNKLDPKILAQVEEHVGVRLAQIDRLTVLVPDVLTRREPGLVLRVTTTEPYDARRVLASLRVPQEDDGRPTSPSRRVFELREPRGLLHLSGPKDITFVFSEKGAIGLLGRLLEREREGGLSPALKAAAEKNHVVAAVELSHFRHLKPDEAPAVQPLLDGRLALVRGNLKAGSAELDLRVSFARKGLAEDGAKAVESVRAELLADLEKEQRRLADDKEAIGQAKILAAIVGALKSAKVSVEDNDVAGAMTVQTGEALEALAREGLSSIRLGSARAQSQNILKQIGLAMHNYHDVYGHLPPAAICDKNGKPLLSWRVAVLPFLEQEALYKQFKLDEPWDSEHNKKLLNVMVKTYTLPVDKTKHEFPSTHYRVLVGNGAMFEQKRGTRFADITDGLSNTFMVVEAADAVPWTKPEELEYDPTKPPKLGFHFGERGNVLFGDGSVRAVRKTINERTLHLLIQRADGLPIPNFPD